MRWPPPSSEGGKISINPRCFTTLRISRQSRLPPLRGAVNDSGQSLPLKRKPINLKIDSPARDFSILTIPSARFIMEGSKRGRSQFRSFCFQRASGGCKGAAKGGSAALELRLTPAAGSRYLPKREAEKFSATWVVPRQNLLPSQAGFRQGRLFCCPGPQR